MKQREALNNLTMDIVKISKRKNKILTIALIVSVLINMFLISMLFHLNNSQSCGIDTCGIVLATAIAKQPSEHITTRQKLKDIAEVKTFEELLERCILTDDEKFLLREHYLRGRSFQSIAMHMGYSEDSIKHKHQKVLKKIKKLL
jgi:DNA-directed RNA polymerase specialized sigma24 family protein